MSTRRNVLIGGACVAAAGTAAFLRPRERLTLLRGGSLAAVVPEAFSGWTSYSVDNLVAPDEGSLAAALYSESVGRVYEEAATGAYVMMLLAYGDTQSDRLQLHRPEVCYPAFGFDIVEDRSANLPLPGGAQLPARTLLARAPERDESILYWSRLGEHLPQTGQEQRRARFQTSLDGFVADGLLARFSIVATPDVAFPTLKRFVTGLLTAVAPADRAALVGSAVSNRMQRA